MDNSYDEILELKEDLHEKDEKIKRLKRILCGVIQYGRPPSQMTREYQDWLEINQIARNMLGE